MEAKQICGFKLLSPWIEYVEKVKALFAADEEVSVEYDDEEDRVLIRAQSGRKAAAISRLVPQEVCFGGVKVKIVVVPGNKVGPLLPDDATPLVLLEAAFLGNLAVTQVRQVSKGIFRDLVYVVFRKEVVQYPADNLGDVNGNRSTLMEDIAREVLAAAEGAFFCTSAVGGLQGAELDKPLGEWP